VPTLALHGINRDSVRNYQLIDEESTQGRGFYQELPAYLRGFRPARSNFAENPLNGNNSRITSVKSYIATFSENLNTKTTLKLKINLIRPYSELNIFQITSRKGYQNLVKLSL
jgi:hypothetical protein